MHLLGGVEGSPAPLERQSGFERELTFPGQRSRQSRHCPRVREKANHVVEAYASRRSNSGTSNQLE
jgi:hypothetical protein